MRSGVGMVATSASIRGEFTFVDVLLLAVRHKWLILVSVFLCAALAGVATLVLPPVYRVDTLLAPVEDSTAGLSMPGGSLGSLAALAGVNVGGSDSVKVEAIALLRSRILTESFLEENNLLPDLFEDAWDAEKEQWKSDDPEQIPNLARGYRKFSRDVRTVVEDKKTGLVTLSIEWTDAEMAVAWSRDLVDRVNRHMRERIMERTEKSLKYLRQELERTNVVEIKQAIHSLVEKQFKDRMIASVQEDYAFQIIDPPALPDPDNKVSPKPVLLIFLGVFLGMFLGLGIALVVEFRNNRFQK